MSKIAKAFMSLILDKKAREALHTAAQQPKSAQTARPRPTHQQQDVKAQLDAKLNEVQNWTENATPPDRKQLIQDAMRVRAAKQEVLADLSQEQRLKLQVLAMKAMMPNKPGGQDH